MPNAQAGPKAMSERVTASLAILKVNWDEGNDYIENFVPFLAECVRIAPQPEVSLPQLQTLMADTFGLVLPQAALKTILKRVASTTVLQSIIRSPGTVRTSDMGVVAAARAPGVRRPWRWMSAHGVQAAPGAPRGVKPLGRRGARRKARGVGGESLARSAAR